MAVVCDTNVLPFRGQGRQLAFEATLVLARAKGLSVLVPEIAFAEATALRRREIEAAFQQAASALGTCKAYTEIPNLKFPEPRALASEWAERLRQRIEVLPTPATAFQEAIRREIERLAPTREGRGARDVVIWLTCLDALQRTSGPVFFVSQNTKDFASAATPDVLRDDLRLELGVNEARFCFVPSLDGLVGRLAEADGVVLEGSLLVESDAVLGAVSRAIQDEVDLRQIDATLPQGHEYLAGPPEPLGCQVLAQRAFRVEEHTHVVADAQWRLTLPLGVVVFSTGGGASIVHSSPSRSVRTQLWLKTTAGRTDVLEADVTAISVDRGVGSS